MDDETSLDSEHMRQLEAELETVSRSRDSLLAEVQEYQQHIARIVDRSLSEVRNSNARLQLSARTKDRFLADMNHSLRTPLTSIIGFTKVLLSEAAGPLNAEQRTQLEMMKASGDQLLAVLDDLLAFTDAHEGLEEDRALDADICSIARSVSRNLERELWERGLRLELDLPSYACPVQADPEILSRAIAALLSGAVELADSNGRVSLRVTDEAEETHVLIESEGGGIPDYELPHGLDRLYRVPGTGADDPSLSGLGFSILLAAVEALDAGLQLSTHPEAGTAAVLVIARQHPGVTTVIS